MVTVAEYKQAKEEFDQVFNLYINAFGAARGQYLIRLRQLDFVIAAYKRQPEIQRRVMEARERQHV